MKYNSFRPGKLWMDTEGKPIQAHGFSVVYSEKDETYYWYGENKEKTTGETDNTIWHWGVRCYASKDLYNWEDKGLIIPPENDLDSPLHPTYCMDRPHIIYCKKTGKYIAWLKIMAGPVSQFMSVLEADEFMGPYRFVKKIYKPLSMDTGDFTLTVDEDTGKGYFIFGRPHFELITAELTEDFTGVTGAYTTNYRGLYPPYAREAPTYFFREGVHYLITSGTSGYSPNPSRICRFTDWMGEYEDFGNPCVGPWADVSFCSQFTCVLKVHGKDLYIAMADRWCPGEYEMEHAEEIYQKWVDDAKNVEFRKKFPEDRSPKKAEPLSHKLEVHRENTSIARYVWLPICWEEGKPIIRWKDEWKIMK